jgi:glycosyltransferase involved in cell wall biosynthesis
VSKGLDLIIPAFARIRQEHPEATLRLITPKHPATLWKKLHQLKRYHQLDEGIEFMHELGREELYDRVCHSTCVLIPSYSEGFCFAAAESIAMHVPVITSGRTALKEVVGGQYIEMERMNAESLYKAMQQALRNEWKETPPRYFPLEATIEQYLDLYLRS